MFYLMKRHEMEQSLLTKNIDCTCFVSSRRYIQASVVHRQSTGNTSVEMKNKKETKLGSRDGLNNTKPQKQEVTPKKKKHRYRQETSEPLESSVEQNMSFRHEDPASTSLVSEDPSVNDYLSMVTLFKKRLACVSEVKDTEELYLLLMQVLEAERMTMENVLKFYSVQRCTSRKRIRSVVNQLTVEQARMALKLFCNVSLFVGVAFTYTQPQFRQAWIMELFQRATHDGFEAFQECYTSIKQYEEMAETMVTSYDSMGRLYGKLTTVLDHQYRIQLKQGQHVWDSRRSPDEDSHDTSNDSDDSGSKHFILPASSQSLSTAEDEDATSDNSTDRSSQDDDESSA